MRFADDVEDNEQLKKTISYAETPKLRRRKNRAARLKIKMRRPTGRTFKMSLNQFLDVKKWWEKPSIVYAFSHPYVRSRLEKLMGSNRISLTDRNFMQTLQSRILADYEQEQEKRIKAREEAEMERVKNLVLSGKIPFDDAPPEMANHPVMLIEMYCRQLIAERRAKIKVLKVKIPTQLYSDDTPDPPSGLSIEKGHVFRPDNDRLCIPPDIFLSNSDEADIEAGYMLTDEDFLILKYETELIRELRACETVDEMYEIADQIIGALLLVEENAYDDNTSTFTTGSIYTATEVPSLPELPTALLENTPEPGKKET